MDVDGRQLYFHGDRNGLLYAIDRTDSSFVWGVPISKVNWMTGFTPGGAAHRQSGKGANLRLRGEGHLSRRPKAANGGTRCRSIRTTKMIFVPSREICVDIKSAPARRGTQPRRCGPSGKPYWGIGTIGWNPGYGQLVAFRRTDRGEDLDRQGAVSLQPAACSPRAAAWCSRERLRVTSRRTGRKRRRALFLQRRHRHLRQPDDLRH